MVNQQKKSDIECQKRLQGLEEQFKKSLKDTLKAKTVPATCQARLQSAAERYGKLLAKEHESLSKKIAEIEEIYDVTADFESD